ncbi:unnamed protein product [Psylliodes chrysocephalus]|uniref:Uncharacterized protein n=1 Tax=Psylliodes chrysocephalus TaxID=3402493 RepID=A0A9P0CTV1_9CUCU|nr:unnamed protein product [Psylliodes chrysocephala]
MRQSHVIQIKGQCSASVYANASPEAKLKMHKKYDEVARILKYADKELAVNEKYVCSACIDLQKVLVTPHSQVSPFYYKSKLATCNLMVYDRLLLHLDEEIAKR